MTKKELRTSFRNGVFERDKFTCKTCGLKSTKNEAQEKLDAHHITDRTLMSNGGYVKTNGITLCKDCHIKAEQFHATGTAVVGFAPNDLYQKIGSSLEQATKDSERLSGD